MDIKNFSKIYLKIFKINKFLTSKAKNLLQHKFKICWDKTGKSKGVLQIESSQLTKKLNSTQSEYLYKLQYKKWDISILNIIFNDALKDQVKLSFCNAMRKLKDIRNEISHFSFNDL